MTSDSPSRAPGKEPVPSPDDPARGPGGGDRAASDRAASDAYESDGPTTASLPSPWGDHVLPEKDTLALRLGSHDLWFRWRDGEIRVCDQDRGAGSGDLATWGFGSPDPEPPTDAEWSRWATPGGEREISLRPLLPERPVVLEPEWPFRLLPGAEARVFVRVPLWIRMDLVVRTPGDQENVRRLKLQETPAVLMSDTWWGELHAGELAYWLPTTARRAMAPRLFAPHAAACPLVLRNQADEDLRVEKLALRTSHLSLFVGEGRIWSDESRVLYQGGEEGSQIEMTGRPPSEAEAAELVSGPRTPVQRGFRARTFDRLRALPGLGGGF
jgi:hypothetical protein